MKNDAQHFFAPVRYELVLTLIDHYKTTSLFQESLRGRQRRFSTVTKLVENYKTTPLFAKAQRYDLFRELRLKLSENETSNITADVFNPQKSPFGKSILIRLLRNTGIEKIATILEQTDDESIVVRRESSGGDSRIDIRVSTKNFTKENVVIDLEMKVNSGSETYDENGKPQTVREWEDLINFAKRKGVDQENIVAYFVTPSAKKAKCKYFHSLSRYKLNQIIREELDNIKDYAKIDKDGVSALRHFFSSSWLF